MEGDSKKRVRGDEDHNNSSPSSSSPKHAKTKDDYSINDGILDLKNDHGYNEDNGTSSSCSCWKTSDSHLALGVFDFPWLKDGIISKSEDWNFEDVFSSPLAHGIDHQFSFLSGQSTCFYQLDHQPDQTLLLDFPENKLEEDVWRPPRDLKQDDDGLGTEGADCIWSSLLNQPLQQPN